LLAPSPRIADKNPESQISNLYDNQQPRYRSLNSVFYLKEIAERTN
jgi:hypothetical protein